MSVWVMEKVDTDFDGDSKKDDLLKVETLRLQP